MKRLLLIMFCAMFSLTGMAQSIRTIKGAVMNEKEEPMSGVTIKAVNSDAETVTDKNGRFELKIDSYIKYVEASYENYITAKAEIDGSYIVFNLKLDKQLVKAKAKAKAEAEAKRAAEQAAAEKAKAEAESKRAAEQAAAEKAKAEAEAKRAAEKAAAEKAKAEAEAKRAAEKAAAEKAKAEAEAKRAAEKAAAEKAKAEAEAKRAAEKAILKAERKAKYSEHVRGYNSVVYASLFSSQSVGVNYIGGYKFNNYLFVGAGVGAEMPLNSYIWLTYKFDNDSYVTKGVTFPVFAHIRANFLNSRCSPFFAFSAGARLMIPQILSIGVNPDSYEYNYISAFINPQLGVNFRVTPKTSVFLSVGANGYTEEEITIINSYQALCKPSFGLGLDFHFGVTF